MGLALGAALVAYPALAHSSLRGLYVFIGAIGAGALVIAAVTATPGLVGLGMLIPMVEYGASLITNERLDWGAPVYGAALLLLGEFAYTLASRRQLGTNVGESRRTVAVVALAALSVLGVVAIPFPHGGPMQALGAGGAAAVVLGLANLARART